MNLTDSIRKHPVLFFFGLTYAINFGVLFGLIFFFPGQPLENWSPAWVISVFSPTIGGLITGWVVGGWAEIKRLLSGYTRWRVGAGWYGAAAFLLLGPLAIALVYIALGNETPGLAPRATAATLLGQFVFIFFSGPFSEELGWRGFALPRLQEKFSALAASLILGVVWCFWHLPLFFLTGASQVSIPFPIYLVLVVTLGVYFTWLYNNTGGSLLITILAHFSFNLSGGFIAGMLGLLPPMVLYMTAGPLLALATVGVVVVFGPRRLTRKPAADQPVLAPAH